MSDPYDRAKAMRAAMTEMGRLLDQVDWGLLDACDCGHRRIEHEDPKYSGGRERCRRCRCGDFSDLHQQADRWRREQLADERKVAYLAAKRTEKGSAA